MKAKNLCEAWTMAAEIFPTDYTKDEQSSENAGYPIYRSTNSHYNYICELGDRLEINLSDGRTINIWIDPRDEEQEIAEIIRNNRIAEEYGKSAQPWRIENRVEIEIMIEGYTWSGDEEKAIFTALKDTKNRTDIIYNIINSYCDTHGIKYTSLDTPKALYLGQKDGSGHFIISAYITPKIDFESMFCQAMIRYYEGIEDADSEKQLTAEGAADTIKEIMHKTYGHRAAADKIRHAAKNAEYIVYGDAEAETATDDE